MSEVNADVREFLVTFVRPDCRFGTEAACTVEVKKLCPYRNRTTTVAVATPWKTTRNCVPAPYVVTTYLGLPLRTYGITFNNYEKYRSFHTCRSSPVASPCSRVE